MWSRTASAVATNQSRSVATTGRGRPHRSAWLRSPREARAPHAQPRRPRRTSARWQGLPTVFPPGQSSRSSTGLSFIHCAKPSTRAIPWLVTGPCFASSAAKGRRRAHQPVRAAARFRSEGRPRHTTRAKVKLVNWIGQPSWVDGRGPHQAHVTPIEGWRPQVVVLAVPALRLPASAARLPYPSREAARRSAKMRSLKGLRIRPF